MLITAGLTRLESEPVPDSVVNSGWGSIVEWLAVGVDIEQAVKRVTALLMAVNIHLPAPRRNELEQVVKELARLPKERSFPIFLAMLGLDDDLAPLNPYRELDEVFVAPQQYPFMQEILRREHVVFILGDPHMGKTYCALRMLWELFRDEGRRPSWIRAQIIERALESGEMGAARLLEGQMRDASAVYVEDPFGQTAPFDVGRFVLSLRNAVIGMKQRDVRMLVTSRTAVFNRVVSTDLARYIVTLSQELRLEQSYSTEALCDLAMQYFDAYSVHWAKRQPKRLAAEVVRVLAAPHNVEEFIRSTRDFTDSRSALSRLEAFQDIVGEYARLIGELPKWQQAFLAVVAHFSNLGIPLEKLQELYVSIRPNESAELGWEAGNRALKEYFLQRGGVPVVRHPSIVEGFEAAAREDAALLERVWLLIDASTRGESVALQFAGLQLLAVYGDILGVEDRGKEIFRRFLDSPHVEVREQSRLVVIGVADRLDASAATFLVDLADASWSDRLMLRLLLRWPAIAPSRTRQLATRLATSRDEQTRYFLASALTSVADPEPIEEAAQILVHDGSRLVRRMAFARIASRAMENEVSEELLFALRGSSVLRDPAEERWVRSFLADRFSNTAVQAFLADLGNGIAAGQGT